MANLHVHLGAKEKIMEVPIPRDCFCRGGGGGRGYHISIKV